MKSYPFVRSGEAILNSVYRLTGDLVGIINRGKYRGQLQIGTNERDCYEEGMNKSSARGGEKGEGGGNRWWKREGVHYILREYSS